MKKKLITACILAAAVFAFAADPVAATLAELNEDATAFHGKDVSTSGKVEKFQQRTSKAGNAYFTFRLIEPGKGREIISVNIFGMGEMKPPLKDGNTVELTGEFKKEKVVSGRTYKNEIEVKPKNVKLVTKD